MRKLFLAFIFIFAASEVQAETLKQDFVTWTRAGFNIESDKSPFGFQLDQQLRLTDSSSKFQSYQTRMFGNYKLDKHLFSLGYILTNEKENNVNNVWALQYTNDWELSKLFNWETRLRLEKRWETEAETADTEESWRGRLRGGLQYKINNHISVLVNNEVFFLEKVGFSENRVQSGFTFKLNEKTSLDLFYQNRFLNEVVDTLEHTVFTNLNYVISL